jgi:hypothetical protein
MVVCYVSRVSKLQYEALIRYLKLGKVKSPEVSSAPGCHWRFGHNCDMTVKTKREHDNTCKTEEEQRRLGVKQAEKEK